MKAYITLCTFSLCLIFNINAQKLHTITVSEDAFTQGGPDANKTMGVISKKQLRVSNSKGKNKYARTTYLKFVLPKSLKSMGTVTLNFPIKVFKKKDNPEAKFKLDIYTVKSNKWKENRITKNNAPKIKRKVGTIDIPQTTENNKDWQSVILNTYEIFKLFTSQRNNTITLALVNNEPNKTSAMLPSREQSDNSASYLEIE